VNIVYLEDNPDDAKLVSRYMKTTAHDLRIVDNLDDAINALAYDTDLIMVDVVIGFARDGLRLARTLREQGFDKPIVAITALTTPDAIDQCYQNGFDHVLNKPFGVSQLAEMISYYAN
jgi:CheY-like chemotaxis protein